MGKKFDRHSNITFDPKRMGPPLEVQKDVSLETSVSEQNLTSEDVSSPDTDILWKQYNLHVDLYKFYLDFILKFNTFFFLITGGLLTYYLANTSKELLRFSLLLPMLMSLGFSAMCFYGAHLLKVTREEVFQIRDRLGLESAPDLIVLSVMLYGFGVLFIIVVLALSLIVIFNPFK